MTKSLILSAAAVALLISAAPSEAGSRIGSNNAMDRWKQQQILDEEFRRAREVGGYNDPFTAFSNLLSGKATEKDIRPGVNTVYDTPAIGTFRLKSRWD